MLKKRYISYNKNLVSEISKGLVLHFLERLIYKAKPMLFISFNKQILIFKSDRASSKFYGNMKSDMVLLFHGILLDIGKLWMHELCHRQLSLILYTMVVFFRWFNAFQRICRTAKSRIISFSKQQTKKINQNQCKWK